ncbi:MULTISPECIES: glycosyltransferase [Nocardiaceae]|uniref:Glycosyltransferase n=1 Tax=Rhodococcoides kroppenstedtii TaxID=293050 RepID=A0ABS7NYR1_9NOCA|nr:MULTISPECIES: glycosyltransferase [Rhodococcus]AMY19971.1 D-inositol 3-phosphate glycosyltransferase [Rhodococcus sp. PBTS 1]MBY6314718.1 glycosyltransferase [Rhodococcus kroppenstedtii]MBY6322525.1 glycosyltransferase [Rhodococcus kroppenstedtii]MBY6401329.1 glycosyltransferase [Rhodococcus kroppenstedtii]
MPNDRRIAVVHERLTEIAGSEHVVEQLSIQWPQAQVHAPIARPEGIPAGLSSPPHTTWLNRIYDGIGQRSYAPVLPLMPLAFRRLPLRDVDAVVVSHHAFATQTVHATDAPVIAYVHSPARWAWDKELRAGEGGGKAGAAILTGLSAVARRCEIGAAPRLRTVVANSSAVAERIANWWGRDDALVVHPPVDTEGFTPDPSVEREDFFLLAGRLVPYKRPDIAIRAAAKAGVRLVVAGDGRAMDQCRALAGPDTEFLGRVSHETLLHLHRSCRALLMPGIEDFGIVPVESMATGTPVIALGEGGALDSVLDGRTGIHVAPGSDEKIVDGFAEAMRSFDPSTFDRADIRSWAEGFSRAEFRRKMQEVVDAAL